jgi:hypothetical protein
MALRAIGGPGPFFMYPTKPAGLLRRNIKQNVSGNSSGTLSSRPLEHVRGKLMVSPHLNPNTAWTDFLRCSSAAPTDKGPRFPEPLTVRATASVFQRRQRIHVNSTEYPRAEALTSHILNSLCAEHLWCNFGKPANAWAARWKAWLRKLIPETSVTSVPRMN